MQIRIRRAVVLQLTYPAIILFAIFYAIPFYSGLMLSNDSAEEYTLHYLRNLAHHGALLLGAGIVVWIVLRLRYVRLALAYVASWLWPIRSVLLRVHLARFLYGLAAMLSAGYSNREAIMRAIPLAGNPMIAWRLARSAGMLDYGTRLADVLAKSRLIPPAQLAQMEAAETTGLPEDGARRCARQLAEEAMQPVSMFVANLEGIAIIVIGYLIVRGMI
jgi:type II secretory pathway component PulF